MKLKKVIKNILASSLILVCVAGYDFKLSYADNLLENEFKSFIQEYNQRDLVVDNGLELCIGEMLDISDLKNVKLSNENTVEITSDKTLKAINTGTVYMSQTINGKVTVTEITVCDNSKSKKRSLASDAYNKEDIMKNRSYYKVFLDPGHGGSDPGALGFGYRESDINLQVAKKVKEKLIKKGIDVKMSRSSDVFCSLEERAEMANNYGADAFVSIHQNSASSESANGIETYYNRNKEEDKPLSNNIQNQLISQTGATNRGVKNAGFAVLVQSNMISSLVECGFISNESEVKKLSDSAYQDKLAEGIADGVENYLKSNVIIDESQITATGKVIKTDSLNIRTGPSTSFDIIGKLSGGDKVNIVGISNNWCKIEYNGTYGYVSASYIELDATEPEEDNTIPDQDNAIGFTDVSESHWAYSQIQDFVQKGYINGYGDNTFRPNEPIKRNEFVKIFNKVFGLTEKSGIVFDDTKDNWAKDEIDIAVTNGVAQGVGENKFAPEEYITREAAAKMLANYMKIEDEDHDEIKKFPDYNQIAEWAKDAFEGNVENGYIQGTDEGILAPKNNITRAEVVTLLSRVNN